MLFTNISYAKSVSADPDYAERLITKHLHASGGNDALMKIKCAAYGAVQCPLYWLRFYPLSLYLACRLSQLPSQKMESIKM